MSPRNRSPSVSPTLSHGVSDEPASWNTICGPPVPVSVTDPDVGVSSPATIRSSVVLPEPLSPTIASASPAAMIEVDAVDGRLGAALAPAARTGKVRRRSRI